jgi:uncharacterized protein (TIGR03437 family)
LKRALPAECKSLVTDHYSVRWRREACCEVDVVDFQASLAEAASARTEDDRAREIRSLTVAAQLYENDILPIVHARANRLRGQSRPVRRVAPAKRGGLGASGDGGRHPPLTPREIAFARYTSSVTHVPNAGRRWWAWIIPGLVSIHGAVTARAQTPILPQGPRNALTYSTYLGGSSNDAVHAVAVDSQGNVYLAGETVSADFPVTQGAFQTKHGGRPGNDCSIFTGCYVPDAFVTKFDPSGKIVYSTYLGGSSSDVAFGIAVDARGDAYVAGTTSSYNFPVTAGAFQATPLNNSTHAFVLKLNPSGSSLIFSTLVGGSGIESVAGIRIDAAGNVFLAGATSSSDFPVTSGAFQTAASQAANPAIPISHGFILKLNAMGSALSYSTYLSGSQGAYPEAMDLTSAGEVVVTGMTHSPDFPVTAGAYQTTISPPVLSIDGPISRFVSRVNARGSALVYSTFLGGDASTPLAGIAVDGAGAAYITADTLAPLPATPGVFSGPISAAVYPSTLYAVKLSPDGTQLIYSVPLIVGTGSTPGAIAVDPKGNVWLTGRTNASDFAVTQDAYQAGYAASACFGALIGPFAGSGDIVNCGDAYLTELDASGSKLLYSTYFGANGSDGGTALALAPDGAVYMAGTSDSALLPATASAPQTHRTLGPDCTFEGSPSSFGSNMCSDVFLSRWDPSAPAPVLPFEVVNSASYLPGAVAPGELVTLFGPGIGSAQPLAYQLDTSGRVANILGGIRVLFDGVPAPLLYVGPSQINTVVPSTTASSQQMQVVVEKNGDDGPVQTIALANVSPGFVVVAPGIFTATGSGIGQAAAFNNQDGIVNGPEHPVAIGSTVAMYVTGLGATDRTVPDGTITDPSVLPVNMGAVQVFIGGKIAAVMYAGAAPYAITGVSQVNFMIPPDTPSGNQPVFVSAGHVESSQSGVWITVQ